MNTTVATYEPPRSSVYRVAVFAYGVVAYAIGVAALLAVILYMLGVFQFTGRPLGAPPLPFAPSRSTAVLSPSPSVSGRLISTVPD